MRAALFPRRAVCAPASAESFRGQHTDAAAIIAILEGIASEQIYTAINKPWSADQQRRHLISLSPRETIHLAEIEREGACGYQVLDLWAPTLDSMAHVGQLGTFLRPELAAPRHRPGAL